MFSLFVLMPGINSCFLSLPIFGNFIRNSLSASETNYFKCFFILVMVPYVRIFFFFICATTKY